MKKKLVINSVKMLFVAIMYVLLYTSCSDDAPLPVNEVLDKGHDDWSKVEFKFTEGHIHGHHEEGEHHEEHHHDHDGGEEFFHGLPEIPNIKFGTVQTYTFESTKNGIKVISENPIRLVQGKAYGLEITYYNKQGERINSEFTTKEMAPIHQHFFIPSQIKSIKEGITTATKTDIISYEYRDTNPENGMFGNEGVTLRGEKDPIGLKGFFDVEKAYQSFNLKVVLVHVIKGSKLDDNGNPYPFYAPSTRVLGTTDLSLSIPMRIFTSYPATDAAQTVFEQDIATEFNLTPAQVKEELKKRGEIDPESGKYKL